MAASPAPVCAPGHEPRRGCVFVENKCEHTSICLLIVLTTGGGKIEEVYFLFFQGSLPGQLYFLFLQNGRFGDFPALQSRAVQHLCFADDAVRFPVEPIGQIFVGNHESVHGARCRIRRHWLRKQPDIPSFSF